MRRATGRESILGSYELPGGKLDYGEQPEDALRRYLHTDVGLHIDHAKLFDAVTYIDHDDRNIQYAVIVYEVTLAGGHHDLSLGENYDEYVWYPMRISQQYSTTDLTQLLLGILQQEELIDETKRNKSPNVDLNTLKNEVIIYSDGGSRGNPGPSASGYVILDQDQKILAQGGEYLGITTNNQAEYHAVRLGLERAKDLGVRSIDFRIDSMLVVNQMNGVYTIKNRELWPINERIRNLVMDFDSVTFSHVPREMNQLADSQVNRVLDEHNDDAGI